MELHSELVAPRSLYSLDGTVERRRSHSEPSTDPIRRLVMK